MAADASLRFLIIGAQRSGSTLLANALGRHPDVALNDPPRPEPKHFLLEGTEATDPALYDRRYFTDLDASVRGEKSTTYIERPDAARRAGVAFPGLRVLAILRDPVERAISNYRFSVDHGLETRPPAQALDPGASAPPWDRGRFSTSPFDYVGRGHYGPQLEAWREVLGGDAMHVLTYEALLGSPTALEEVQEFLGVDIHGDVRLPAPVNASRASVAEAELLGVRRRLARHFVAGHEHLRVTWGLDVRPWRRP